MVNPSSKRLGKGIGSLLSNRHATDVEGSEGKLWVSRELLTPNSEQPRVAVDKGVERLAESLRRHGMMQPIVVTVQSDGSYEILAGERRWRASELAGMKSVPIIVREGSLSGDEKLELALIENIQREDLDSIEKAKGCARLMSEYNLTQEDVAAKLGYQRSTVANLVRLLDLPVEIQDDVSRETITAGHARALLKLQDTPLQAQAWQEIKAGEVSVRGAEKLCASLAKGGREPKHMPRASKPAWAAELQDKLTRSLGLRAEIKLHARGGGKLVLHFAELDDLDRLVREVDMPSELEELMQD
ncbi:MAG: ParB/RepB/Spo0J family partition protein [Planctomycetes bacterium]|nr:ParB/RepB/Spo0J family partition protein [Planctomycetota bacterium]MCP4860823.1 ParB/RepB/Spo0J family partition protein [Planctomycetota bacterium]